MSQNWMRHFELQLFNEKGQGISLSDFKVTFRIEWADTRWPRVANVRIYNLSTATNNRILGQEFSRTSTPTRWDKLAVKILGSFLTAISASR
jgi:hypothetical protein